MRGLVQVCAPARRRRPSAAGRPIRRARMTVREAMDALVVEGLLIAFPVGAPSSPGPEGRLADHQLREEMARRGTLAESQTLMAAASRPVRRRPGPAPNRGRRGHPLRRLRGRRRPVCLEDASSTGSCCRALQTACPPACTRRWSSAACAHLGRGLHHRRRLQRRGGRAPRSRPAARCCGTRGARSAARRSWRSGAGLPRRPLHALGPARPGLNAWVGDRTGRSITSPGDGIDRRPGDAISSARPRSGSAAVPAVPSTGRTLADPRSAPDRRGRPGCRASAPPARRTSGTRPPPWIHRASCTSWATSPATWPRRRPLLAHHAREARLLQGGHGRGVGPPGTGRDRPGPNARR